MELKRPEAYEELIGSLDGLIKHYRQLLETVRKEKDILTAAKLDDLIENNKVKDGLLVRIRSLENTRMKTAREIAQMVGADVDAPRLLDLAIRFQSDKGDRLRTLHATLDLLIKRVSEVNKQNEVLVKSALSHIGGAMDSIREGLKEKPTYARQGALASGAGAAGSLVSREA